MRYNFDEMIPRRGTNCEKWDGTDMEGVLPLWVADMWHNPFRMHCNAV